MRKVITAVLLIVAVLMLATAPASAAPNYFYSAHVQGIGWQDASWDAGEAGTTGQSLRVESLHSPFKGQQWRAHVQDIGWQEWRTGDEAIGTTGQSLRMEALEVVSTIPGVKIHCQAHVQNLGWLEPVGDGELCGTTGRGLRLEAVRMWVSNE